VQRVPDGLVAQAGPDAVHLSTPVELHGENLTTVAEFTVHEGSSERFVLSWFPSYESPGRTEDAHAAGRRRSPRCAEEARTGQLLVAH